MILFPACSVLEFDDIAVFGFVNSLIWVWIAVFVIDIRQDFGGVGIFGEFSWLVVGFSVILAFCYFDFVFWLVSFGFAGFGTFWLFVFGGLILR